MFFIKRKRSKIERIYYNYRTQMYKEAYKYLQDKSLSEDAVQLSIEKMIKNIHNIDEGNIPRTRNYMVTVTRNTAKDMLREKNKYEYFDDMADYDSNPIDIIIGRETVAELAEAIEALPEIYRDVLIMRRVNDLSVSQIAEIMNISADAVKKRLTRAKHMLAEQMEGGEKHAGGK